MVFFASLWWARPHGVSCLSVMGKGPSGLWGSLGKSENEKTNIDYTSVISFLFISHVSVSIRLLFPSPFQVVDVQVREHVLFTFFVFDIVSVLPFEI